MRFVCRVRLRAGASFVASASPARRARGERRWVKVQYQQRLGHTWRGRGEQWAQVSSRGLVRVRAKDRRLRSRGFWRVRVVAGEHQMLGAATSRWRYLSVR